MARQVRHRSVNSIWLYDYSQFEVLSQDRDRVLFLSMMDMNLIWNAIQNINLLQTRVYTEADGQFYSIVDDAQFEMFGNWVADLRNHLGEYLVTNAILEGILEQLTIIANRECCPGAGTGQGSRGSGGTEVPIDTYDEDTSGGDPPAGFADMEVFNLHKCNAAQDLINNLGSDLQGLSGIEYSAQTPSGIAALLIGILLTPVPFDDLVALAGYLIFTGYNYALLSTMSLEIDTNNDEILCILYSANSAETAKSEFYDKLQEIAEAVFTLPEDAEWVMGAIDWMLSNDAFNKLFQPGPTISQEADCSGCGPADCTGQLFQPPGQSSDWGSVISWDGITLSGSSEFGDGAYRFNFNFIDAMEEGCCRIVESISITGASHDDADDFYYPCGSSEVAECPDGDAENLVDECIHALILASDADAPFTLTVVFSETPCVP